MLNLRGSGVNCRVNRGLPPSVNPITNQDLCTIDGSGRVQLMDLGSMAAAPGSVEVRATAPAACACTLLLLETAPLSATTSRADRTPALRHARVPQVNIQDLAFVSGYMDDTSGSAGEGGGGAVEIRNAAVTLQNVVFMHSRMVHKIEASRSPSTTSGGALSIVNAPRVVVDQSYFLNNSAQVRGPSSARIASRALTVLFCAGIPAATHATGVFAVPLVQGHGGAMFVKLVDGGSPAAQVALRNSAFANNSALNDGTAGAVYVVEESGAGSSGSADSPSTWPVNVNVVTFEGNVAGGQAGAMFAGRTANIVGATFRRNIAAVRCTTAHTLT